MNTPVNRYHEQITRTGNPKEWEGKYLAETIYCEFPIDDVDPDTGEMITITKQEVIAFRGSLLDKDTISRILFHQQAGECPEELPVTNARRAYRESRAVESLFEVKAKEYNKGSSYSILTAALCADMATAIARDYLEQIAEQPFYFTSVKNVPIINLIGEVDNDKTLYEVRARSERVDSFIYAVFATDGDDAVRRVLDITANNPNEAIARFYQGTVMLSCKPLSYTHVIPREFSDDYLDDAIGFIKDE